MRLTDLSKMLLSSPAFSTFLNDLSANGVPGLPQAIANQQQRSLAQQMQQQQQQPQQQAPKPQPPKDLDPHQSRLLLQQQQQRQQAQASVASQEMDFSNLDANGSWGVGMDFGFDAQVFQVTELPSPEQFLEAPVDTSLLSGKPLYTPSGFGHELKPEAPVVETIAEFKAAMKSVEDESVEFDATNPAYALFADDVSLPSKETTSNTESIFGAVAVDKVFARIELVVSSESSSDGDLSTTDMVRVAALRSQLEELSARLAAFTP